MKSFLSSLLLISGAFALPSNNVKRFNIKSEDTSTQGTSDVNILTYALTLEHLENAFYRGGLANFTADQFAAAGFDATVYSNIQRVAADEANHVQFLTSALGAVGANVPQECLYSFPYTDPATFVALATVLEGVGVSAYLGAAADIVSPDYLTAAASVLTVEARHASYLRAQIGESPYPAPYDIPLDFDQVHSLAWPFFVSCPSTNPKLGVTAFPKLSLATTGPITPNSTITLSTMGYVLSPVSGTDAQLYGAFLTPTGPIFQPATAVTGGYSVQVPAGVAGQAYVVITACADSVSDDTTIAGPAIVEVQPAVL